jgi:beta-lactamase class C
MIKRFTFIFLLIVFQIKASAFSNTKVETLVLEFMKNNQIEGMSVAVINKDKTFISNYGFANSLKKTPTTNDTIYTIASFTKTFTATIAAVAAVNDVLDLTHPFTEYFPAVKDSAPLNSITSQELLAHVSSLPFDFDPRPQTYASAVNELKNFVPLKPGTKYGYSNAGIGTVGYILQNIYSLSYQDILEHKLLKPLNMNSTYLNVPVDKEKYIALGHNKDNQTVLYTPNLETWFAAASLKSTITDMATYLKAHMNYSQLANNDLSKAISLVHKNYYCFSDKVSCEQLAWQAHLISELNSSQGDTYFIDYDSQGMPLFDKKDIIKTDTLVNKNIFIDKTGSGYGMSGYMAYIPDEQLGVVILLNKVMGNERIRLGRDILKAFKSA